MMTYNKIYYLGVVIIIGLVAWLVIDFVQNKTQADNILADLPKSPPPDKSITVLAPPVLPQIDWNRMWGPKVEEVKAPPVATPPKPNFILTGTLIEPTSPKAFILIPARNNEEKICKIGDKIDDWEIIEIISDEAKLKNSQGEILVLRIQKQWPSPASPQQLSVDILNRIPSGINIPGVSQEFIKNVLEGKEPAEQVKASIKSIVPLLPPAYVRKLIKELTDFDDSDIPADDSKLGDYATHLFGQFQGEPSPTGNQVVENITFATRVNADNSAIAPQASFKPGDRRLYACFSNQGALTGLAKVVTRWTNKTTGELAYLGTKQIDPNAVFNFIWIEKKEGWPSGEYEVELCNTQTLEKIAGGKFSIAP